MPRRDHNRRIANLLKIGGSESVLLRLHVDAPHVVELNRSIKLEFLLGNALFLLGRLGAKHPEALREIAALLVHLHLTAARASFLRILPAYLECSKELVYQHQVSPQKSLGLAAGHLVRLALEAKQELLHLSVQLDLCL